MTEEQPKTDSAVLTTEERKELPATTFCGPNRSFPVNDAAHVRAALSRLPQSKYSPEQKRRILACIKRKAKTFGVDVSETKSSLDASNPGEFDVDDGGVIGIWGVKPGTAAITPDGSILKYTADALQRNFKTWEGGILTLNHNRKHSFGTINSVEMREKNGENFAYFKVAVTDSNLRGFIKEHRDKVGVSVETDVAFHDDNHDITDFNGSGITIMLPSNESEGCSPDEGCVIDIYETASLRSSGIPGVLEVVGSDGEVMEKVVRMDEHIKSIEQVKEDAKNTAPAAPTPPVAPQTEKKEDAPKVEETPTPETRPEDSELKLRLETLEKELNAARAEKRAALVEKVSKETGFSPEFVATLQEDTMQKLIAETKRVYSVPPMNSEGPMPEPKTSTIDPKKEFAMLEEQAKKYRRGEQ